MLPEQGTTAGVPRDPSLPHVAICILIRAEHEYAWDLIARSLLGLDYPADHRHLLLLTEGGSPSLEAAVRRFTGSHAARFGTLQAEMGMGTVAKLKRASALTDCFALNDLTRTAALRQRMVEWVLDEEQLAADYALFLNGETLWPRHVIHALLALTAEYGDIAAGIAPAGDEGSQLRLAWSTNPPVGRQDIYDAADVPPLPFPVDLAPLDGALVPVNVLREFQAAGGWYTYAASGYPENGQEEHAYLLLGNRRRLPVWVSPEIVGWRVGREGSARCFQHHPETGTGQILTARWETEVAPA